MYIFRCYVISPLVCISLLVAAKSLGWFRVARARMWQNGIHLSKLAVSEHGWRIVETPGGAFRLVIVKFNA